MKNEIKDRSGKLLFITEQNDNKLYVNDPKGQHICCIEHEGNNVNIKDKDDKVINQYNPQ